MEHVTIEPRTPQLDGQVERSHRADTDEFYQRLTHRDDVDLEKKRAVWERFCDYDRPRAPSAAVQHPRHCGRSCAGE
jgi:hypothetical protein